MELQKRKSPRLKGFDYGANEEYFVTICTDNHKKILSEIVVGEGLAPPEIKLSPLGKIAEAQILDLPTRFPDFVLEGYVIIPDHIHILAYIVGKTGGASPSPTLSAIICSFKSLTARFWRKDHPSDKIWQRSFYDHVIRNQKDYIKHFDYIEDNPVMWIENKHVI